MTFKLQGKETKSRTFGHPRNCTWKSLTYESDYITNWSF